jgi:hypothetical protein
VHGTLLLGSAGPFHGLRVATHWVAYDELRTYGTAPTEQRVVRTRSSPGLESPPRSTLVVDRLPVGGGTAASEEPGCGEHERSAADRYRPARPATEGGDGQHRFEQLKVVEHHEDDGSHDLIVPSCVSTAAMSRLRQFLPWMSRCAVLPGERLLGHVDEVAAHAGGSSTSAPAPPAQLARTMRLITEPGAR